ncbi:MAG: hypothetical protein MJE12_07600 [Alphaproteobacteria bacterium]|nr:hypothetical protein [Alphaproteobacteria bacterium]
MKNLAAIFALVGVLAFWSGTDVANAANILSCDTTKCTFNETIGKSKVVHFHGHCGGSGNTEMTQENSHMVCHKADHLTCTAATWNYYKGDPYWACTCTNHSGKHDANTTVDLTCPPPS